MSSIVVQLAEILSGARRPGDFYTSGTTELLAPSLSVDGVGPVALPLLPVQAVQLVAAAARAPYGRGPETIVDPTVRNSWQISPERVRIGCRHWPQTLATILSHVAEGLGVSDPVEAALYKVLIYEQGSFFVPHRDTEKAPGMFATLVIVLPSSCTGGELVVRHKDRSVQLDLRGDDPAEAAFAAFYADCLHEVRPVTAGYRLTLIYNLIRSGKGKVPQPPNYTSEQQAVAALLRDWRSQLGAGVPEKLVYPLEHAYTAPELGFDVLKGADAAAANVLTEAASQADCALHLALVTLEESGSAEYSENYGRRRRWSDDSHDDGEFEVGEVFDGHIALSHWCARDGETISWGEIPVLEEELSPPDPFEDLKPDELHFQEASGNEGVSFERRYQRAALVVWPNDRALAVLTQAGLGVTVPHLRDLAGRWAGTGADPLSPIRQQAHELAGHMIDQWPPSEGRPVSDSTETETTGMLAALTVLGDTDRIDGFLTRVPGTGIGFARQDCAAIIAALAGFPAEQAGSLVHRVVTANAAKRFAACANLLARAVSPPLSLGGGLRDAAASLLASMPSDSASLGAWWPRDHVEPGFVADLLIGSSAIDPGLADRAVALLLENPKTYDIDTILVPAARDRLRAPTVAAQPAVARLRAACLTHLRARIALPLAAPTDWRRPSDVGCQCPRCRELSRFLDDPTQQTWIFRAAAPDRGHVEGTIRTALCDVDTRTEQRGRPYSLICKKNEASYRRRVAQRNQDLENESRLAG